MRKEIPVLGYFSSFRHRPELTLLHRKKEGASAVFLAAKVGAGSDDPLPHRPRASHEQRGTVHSMLGFVFIPLVAGGGHYNRGRGGRVGILGYVVSGCSLV